MPRIVRGALSLRARFDVEQKALDAIVFTVAAGGTSLAIPFKRLPTVSTMCCGNSALIEIESATVQEADEIRRLERELHEDLIEYEFQRIERENARLYGGSYVPPCVCEPGRFIPEML